MIAGSLSICRVLGSNCAFRSERGIGACWARLPKPSAPRGFALGPLSRDRTPDAKGGPSHRFLESLGRRSTDEGRAGGGGAPGSTGPVGKEGQAHSLSLAGGRLPSGAAQASSGLPRLGVGWRGAGPVRRCRVPAGDSSPACAAVGAPPDRPSPGPASVCARGDQEGRR